MVLLFSNVRALFFRSPFRGAFSRLPTGSSAGSRPNKPVAGPNWATIPEVGRSGHRLGPLARRPHMRTAAGYPKTGRPFAPLPYGPCGRLVNKGWLGSQSTLAFLQISPLAVIGHENAGWKNTILLVGGWMGEGEIGVYEAIVARALFIHFSFVST